MTSLFSTDSFHETTTDGHYSAFIGNSSRVDSPYINSTPLTNRVYDYYTKFIDAQTWHPTLKRLDSVYMQNICRRLWGSVSAKANRLSVFSSFCVIRWSNRLRLRRLIILRRCFELEQNSQLTDHWTNGICHLYTPIMDSCRRRHG